MKLFYSLYGYLLLGMIVLIGVDEYLSFHAEIQQYEADMITNAVQDGRSMAGMIAHTWRENGESKALALIEEASKSGMIHIRWVWPHLLIDKFAYTTEEKEQLQNVISGKTASFKMSQKDGSQLRYTYVPVDVGKDHKGALELRETLVSYKEYYKNMMIRALTITSLLALVCGMILYFFMNKKIRMPLNSLMLQAKRIGEGDLSANNSISGNDELAEMAQTMNDMCSRLLIAKEKINFEYDARVKALEQLRHTERLSSFGVLSASIAHELGTPLNVIDGRAKMILNEDLQQAEIHDCAKIITNQSERMTQIIRQLLDFTRRPERQSSSENVAFLIKQIFQLLHPMASKQQVTLHLSKDEDTDIQLNADFSQIQQVLVNLLINAIQAMPDGGKVEVTLSNERISASANEEPVQQKYLKIRIQDEGEGICEENLQHIFTPFFTTKTIGTGTGLGLSIAHGIVEEHGGWIDIESTVQNGACFSVYLPMRGQVR
ncbi:HAMP domain-containing sensor histidine kinase [Desulforhopalus sp. IMCC35007]|uniref:sensor histidine kinase n=1 Tax=Desulforhopalus sp. IMCC35007 TaxID=2569543 RepID=UPI0010AE87C9|nr:HAMP domain-containing sensor histidine kinase [Desulforhopalus sp. IMCC35007]TKB11697.1 HAMP domain-containing histidine kinase [Desulforhopalus sp. IMCC35007]